MGNVRASKIAKFINLNLIGDDLIIDSVCPLNLTKANCITFSKKNNFKLSANCLVIVPIDFNEKDCNFSYIKAKNPRLSFAKIVNNFFMKDIINCVDKSAKIGNNCSIDKTASIGANTIIGDNVKIGKNTIINSNIVICDNTYIGDNCYIKSGSVIGEDGFGFDFEENGTPVRIPHIGNVIVGNSVEIGAKNTIARATLGSTVIKDNVKTDDQVHIAHNCYIDKNTIITACVEISGSVEIGKNCWLGPNSSVIQKIKLGNNVTIGIGTIVTKDIEKNNKIMGFEGLDLRSLLKLKKRIEYGK